jgi:hypothetical protein
MPDFTFIVFYMSYKIQKIEKSCTKIVRDAGIIVLLGEHFEADSNRNGS